MLQRREPFERAPRRIRCRLHGRRALLRRKNRDRRSAPLLRDVFAQRWPLVNADRLGNFRLAASPGNAAFRQQLADVLRQAGRNQLGYRLSSICHCDGFTVAHAFEITAQRILQLPDAYIHVATISPYVATYSSLDGLSRSRFGLELDYITPSCPLAPNKHKRDSGLGGACSCT